MGTKTPLFDWNKGEFIVNRYRRIETAEEGEALKMVIEKAVRTARNKYLIYSDKYGNDAFETRKLDLPLEVKEKEIAQDIREAVEYDYRVKGLTGLSVSFTGDLITVEYEVISIFDKIERGSIIV